VTAISVLRHKDYRSLWLGSAGTVIASQILAIAVAWDVYTSTGSAVDLGLLGLARGVPLVVLPLVGGAVADLYDRRRVVVLSQILLLVACGALALDAAGRFWLPLVYLCVALAATASSFETPTRNAAIPRLVPAEELAGALTLGSLTRQVGFVVGPGVGGLLLGLTQREAPYVVAAGLALGAVVATSVVPPLPPATHIRTSAAAAVAAGLQYIRRDRLVLGLIALAVAPNTVGATSALLPIFARDVLHVGGGGLGVLAAAGSAGALAGGLALASRRAIPRPLTVVVGATYAIGLCLLGFALSRALLLSMAFLFAAGIASVVTEVTRSTALLLHAPDELRGRVTSVLQIVLVGGPQLGGFEQASLAGLVGPVGAGVFAAAAVTVATAASSQLTRQRDSVPVSP